MSEAYVPKRGDLVNSAGWDKIGLVAGWIDEELIYLSTLPEEEVFIIYHEPHENELLASREKIEAMEYDPAEADLPISREKLKELASTLPTQIELQETRPFKETSEN